MPERGVEQKPPDWKTIRAQLFLEERYLLKELAETVVERFGSNCVVVNIGVACGGSMYCMRAGASEAIHIGVDWNLDWRPMVGRPATILMAGDSGELWRYIQEPIHLLFVDGGHSEKAVWRDINGWVPKIAPGGFVAFHDYHERRIEKNFGVRRAVDRWMGSWGATGEWRVLDDVRLTKVFERDPGFGKGEASELSEG